MMNVCRLCLGNVYISEFEYLPKMVCHSCSSKVDDMAKFREIVMEADQQLRKLISGDGKVEELYNEIMKKNVTIKHEQEFEQSTPNLTKPPAHQMVEEATQTEFIQIECVLHDLDDKDASIRKEEIEDFVDENKYNDANLDDYLSSDDNILLINLSTAKQFVKQETDDLKPDYEIADTKPQKARDKNSKFLSDWSEDVKHKTRGKNAKKKPGVNTEMVKSKGKTPSEVMKECLEQARLPKDLPETNKKWKCLTCFICVDSRIDLLAHYKQHVVENGKHVSSEGAGDKTQESDTTPEYIIVKRGSSEGFLCVKCNKVFSAKKYIRKHAMSHIQDRPYVCNMCGRTYNKAYEIVLHGRAHSGSKTLFCNYEDCAYSTVYKGALTSHQRKHDDNFKYKCKICHKGFDVLTWYSEHHNVHTGIKPFKCDLCDKAFVYSRYLTSHQKSVHPESCPPSAERLPLKCLECGVEKTTRRALWRHMRQHNAGEVVLCDICGKALASRDHLMFHRRIHLGVKPHVCRTCGKAFVKKYNLKQHERVHSGEKPHVCSHCGKAFAQRSTLVIHERYHSGARPYKCEVCQKAFVASGLLSVHQKKCVQEKKSVNQKKCVRRKTKNE